MADQNILGSDQAINEWVQQQTKHIEGQPVRVYPFKIVSGLSYFTNKGQKPLGSNPGATTVSGDNTATNESLTGDKVQPKADVYGAYSGVTTMFSGAKPLIAYWFGVTNVTIGDDGMDNAVSNRTTEYLNVKWVNPVPLTDDMTIPDDALFTPKQFQNPFENNKNEFPWKELGLQAYSVSSGKEQHSETLDNLKIACYETSYDYSMYSTDWVPNFQQINEFVYFIVDVRCACPIALRITSVEPHYDAVGILQDCTINFSSINQYYNNNGRNVLTYVKFGPIGDDYAFPKEMWYADPNNPNAMPTFMTVLDKNLFQNRMGGVNQIEVKNNSLTAQLGALVYGHPYVPFHMVYDDKGDIILQKTWYADDYLIPWRFTAPCQDLIDVSSETVHSVYDLAMNMLLINEQIWGNWKQTKEYYNVTQNFTFQGGLAFDDPTLSKQLVDNGGQNPVEKWVSTLFGVERNVYTQTFGTQVYNTWAGNAPGMNNLGLQTQGYGSKNIANVILSNANGSSLDVLSNPNNVWYEVQNPSTVIHGFALPPSGVFDFRGTGFTSAFQNAVSSTIGAISGAGLVVAGIIGAQDSIDLYYNNNYQPSNLTDSEILSLTNYPNGGFSDISVEKFFTLNSFSMINTHQLEINYRDGIVYTNTDQGHNGLINDIANMIGHIEDIIGGYTPGFSNFFMNTYARTYNILLPHMVTMLAEQYINPTNAVYNAIPLDIFANTNQNNTSVGQLKYLSGYQYILTNWFKSNIQKGARVETTTQMRYANLGVQSDGKTPVSRYVNPQDPANPNFPQLTQGTYNMHDSTGKQIYMATKNGYVGVSCPYNSLIYFDEPAEPLTTNQKGHTSFVIDAVNVKQIGVSNLHITYWKEVPDAQSEANCKLGEAYQKTTLQSVGEEWLENTAKMMNNTSYIDNYVSYDIYDEMNTSVQKNCEPYLAFQFPPDPIIAISQQQQEENQAGDTAPGLHVIPLDSDAPVQGVDFTNNSNPLWTSVSEDGTTQDEYSWYPYWQNSQQFYMPFTLTGSYQSNFDPTYTFTETNWQVAGTTYDAYYYNASSNGKEKSTVYTGIYWPSTNPPVNLLKLQVSNALSGYTQTCPTLSANTNQWWLNACSNASDTPTDGYLPGTIESLQVSTWLATIQALNGWNKQNVYTNSSSDWTLTNDWLGLVKILYPAVPNANTPQNTGHPNNQYPSTFIESMDGIFQPYTVQVIFYVMNFSKLVDACETYWEYALPTSYNITPSSNLNWNYVLIPHGADPNTYIDNWQFANVNANNFPFINTKDAVILIEPGSYNNVVFYNGNYAGTYTPNMSMNVQWYNGIQACATYGLAGAPSSPYIFAQMYGIQMNGGLVASSPWDWVGNSVYGFTTFTSITDLKNAQGTWNQDTSTEPKVFYNIWSSSQFPLNSPYPQLPFQNVGLACSFVSHNSVPTLNNFNTLYNSARQNQLSGVKGGPWPVQNNSVDGVNYAKWPGIIADNDFANADAQAQGSVIHNLRGWPNYVLAQFNNANLGQGWNSKVPVPSVINPGSNDWPHLIPSFQLVTPTNLAPSTPSGYPNFKQASYVSQQPTWQDGKYDLYIFYNIYD